MVASKINPKATFESFHTKETFTAVARKLGVTRNTLRRWWVAEFGEPALQKRLALRSDPEEKKARRRVRLKADQERIRSVKRAWRKDNPDKVKESKRRHYKDHRETHLARCKVYYTKNAKRARAAAKQYRSLHRETLKKTLRELFENHPEHLMFRTARQRAAKLRLPFEITVKDVLALLPPNGKCPITGEPFEMGVGKVGPRSRTLDRIIPMLGYVPGNLAVISHLANTIKQNCTDPRIFRRIADYVEKKGL